MQHSLADVNPVSGIVKKGMTMKCSGETYSWFCCCNSVVVQLVRVLVCSAAVFVGTSSAVEMDTAKGSGCVQVTLKVRWDTLVQWCVGALVVYSGVACFAGGILLVSLKLWYHASYHVSEMFNSRHLFLNIDQTVQ